jgi:hypothetical protein
MSQGLSLSAVPAVGYLQRKLPAYVILASFLVLTVPLAVLAGLEPDSPRMQRIQFLYICCLGLTHFVLTPTIYLQSANLRYYNSSWRNRLLYFVIPAAILVGFNLYGTLRIALLFPLFDTFFRLAIRLFDFQHLGRQSFGVLQLFKGRSGAKFPTWLRLLETYYFFALPLLLLTTFMRGGRFDPAYPGTQLMVALVALLFLVVLTGYALALVRSPRPGALGMPLAYLLFQTVSALLAVYSTALYGIALAMHYVEYHVLMVPRCFDVPLDPQRAPDRLFSRLRRNKLVFYGVILVLAAVASVMTRLSLSAMMAMMGQVIELWRNGPEVGSSPFYLFLITMFDGIFVFHYFLECFIWKFSDPHYRQTLGPLYFAPRPAPAAKC